MKVPDFYYHNLQNWQSLACSAIVWYRPPLQQLTVALTVAFPECFGLLQQSGADARYEDEILSLQHRISQAQDS